MSFQDTRAVLLAAVHAHVIHRHALRELRGRVGITRPVAAHRQVQQQEERVIVHPFGAQRQIGGGDALERLPVHQKLDARALPDHGVDMEGVGEAAGSQGKRRADSLTAGIAGTVHGPGYSGGKGIGAPFALASGRFADAFHVYTVIWERASIEFLVDGQSFKRVTPADLPEGAKWVYDHPFFLLLNLAVGGNWPGNPDASTEFPQPMTVDYVRVYSRQ